MRKFNLSLQQDELDALLRKKTAELLRLQSKPNHSSVLYSQKLSNAIEDVESCQKLMIWYQSKMKDNNLRRYRKPKERHRLLPIASEPMTAKTLNSVRDGVLCNPSGYSLRKRKKM